MKTKISFLVSISAFSLAANTAVAQKLPIQQLEIITPPEQGAAAISLSDLPLGTYRLKEVHTFVSTLKDGAIVKGGFRHTIVNAGSPKREDPVEYGISEVRGMAPGKFLQLAPEIFLPLSINANEYSVTFNDQRFYWNYVRSNGEWTWLLNSESETGGMPLRAAILSMFEEKPGHYTRHDAQDKQVMKGQVELMGDRLTILIDAQVTKTEKMLVKLTYSKGAFEKDEKRPIAVILKGEKSSSKVSQPSKTTSPANGAKPKSAPAG